MIQHRNEPPGTPPLPPTIRPARLKLLEDITYGFYVVNGSDGWTFDGSLSVRLPRDSILYVYVDMEQEPNTFSISYYKYPDGQRIEVDIEQNMIDVRVPQNFNDETRTAVTHILFFQQLDPSKYEELGLEHAMGDLHLGETLRI